MQTETEKKQIEYVTVTHEVQLEDISDLLCSALEGGSNYWYEIIRKTEPPVWKYAQKPAYDDTSGLHFLHDYPLNHGGTLVFKSKEEPEKGIFLLNQATIREGLRVMGDKYPKHFADFINEDGDATTGDVFLQCCLFGEVIYG